MNNEQTITLMDRDVRVRYCAATETTFEELTGKSIEIFLPTFGEDAAGNSIITEQPKATRQDFLTLGIAGILAAYLREKQDPPITTEEILYEASPNDVVLLITTLLQLRNDWYAIAIPEPEEAGRKKAKN